jgi:hypothetical protein
VWVLTEADSSFEQLIHLGAVHRLAIALDRHVDDAAPVTAVAHALAALLVDHRAAGEARARPLRVDDRIQ